MCLLQRRHLFEAALDRANTLHHLRGEELMTRSLQLYCVRVTAFSQTDLFLDWISREWDSHRSPMTNYKKLSWRYRVTEPERPLFFYLFRGKG